MKNIPKHTVLIVDDTPENIHVLINALKDDYLILVAKDGEKALRIVQEETLPDLILLDILMPGMDGYEVCRRLKSDEYTRDIPVIFITVLSEVEDETRGLELGAIDYITKPFHPGIVQARVRNHIALREAARLREDIDRILRHDLRAPLSNIVNLLPLLLESPLTSEQRELVTLIHDAGHRMLQMINMSLRLHKIETGQYRLDPSKLDLPMLLQLIVHRMEHLLAPKNLSIEIQQEGLPVGIKDPLFIYGEEVLCICMFENLLKNACEASPAGAGIVVSLSTLAPFHVVSITNQGEVPATIRGRFFEKYVTEGKKHGTGLGTYSAKLAAQAHGGSIELDTSREGWTTVTVRLPIRLEQALPAGQQVVGPDARATP